MKLVSGTRNFSCHTHVNVEFNLSCIVLFLSELTKIFIHYSYFIPIAPPIIPFIFYCVNDSISKLYSLTALIEYLSVLLKYLDLFASWVAGCSKDLGRPGPC